MRKFILSAFVLLLSVTAVLAQSAEDNLKDASKAYASYTVGGDEMDLQTAADKLEMAMAGASALTDYKDYLEAGEIYTGITNEFVKAKTLDPASTPLVKQSAALAAEAYMKAYQMSEKKGGKKQALKGLQEIQQNLSNSGIYSIQDKDYMGSYKSFVTSLAVHEFLTENGGESMMTDDKQVNDERYYAALSAILLGDNDAAEPLFLSLYEDGYDDSGIYDGLYKIYAAKDDMDTAGKYLTEGRQKYPEETQLLFTEINYYLQRGELDQLTGKLEEAIEKEPENVSLYSTLGSVYDKLYASNAGEGNTEKANEYFELAKQNYERGLSVEPGNASLTYSIGALYYNRAANKTQQLSALGDDFSKEGQKKYEAMKAEVDAEFEKALPYFKQAEMNDPNNKNTLIALKEMYARVDDYDTSNEFKTRIERLDAGETISDSYFKANGGK